MESQGEDIVINPVTREPVEDPTLAQAIKEGSHYITKRGKPRVIVDWPKFMRQRRGYMGIPKYFGLTNREVQTYMKISREALVPIQIIARVWGIRKHQQREILDFCDAKQIPVYRWPVAGKGKQGYYVFSGDITRAIESCKVDLKADGGAWKKMSTERWEKRKRQEAKDRANRELRRNQAGADTEDAPSPRAGRHGG